MVAGHAGERQFGLPNGLPLESIQIHSPPRSVYSTTPPKKFGSGTRSDPSVPYSSIGEWPCLHTSQLMANTMSAPLANRTRAITVVGVSTLIAWPLRGPPAVTIRSAKAVDVRACTL